MTKKLLWASQYAAIHDERFERTVAINVEGLDPEDHCVILHELPTTADSGKVEVLVKLRVGWYMEKLKDTGGKMHKKRCQVTAKIVVDSRLELDQIFAGDIPVPWPFRRCETTAQTQKKR